MAQGSQTELVAGLRAAIAEDRIVPWFQPVMDPAGVDMLSAEALPRWDDPVRGMVPAGVFIQTAQASGLLPEVSRILLEKACANFATWRMRGIAPPVVSVNFTGEELRSPRSVDQLQAAAERHGIRPGEIAIEIVEECLQETGWEQNLAGVARLREMGVSFWLDDFGTGPGDPGILARVDFALAKVDRGIVGRLDEDPAMVERLRSLVEMARTKELAIIAKGVETREQIDILVGLGCNGQQGFAIARPMPEDSFAEWLDLNTWPGAAAG